jgi:hypothetical protein
MELAKFKGNLYGKLKTQLFIWEAAWDSFRPVESIAWNGREIVVIDSIYKEDIFDPYYGYGSPEMKLLCRRLTDITELDGPEKVPWFTEWWRDRYCNFTECCPRDTGSWKKFIAYTGSRVKTLRVPRSSRATRRSFAK